MHWTSILVTGMVALYPSWVSGQQSGWIPNQVNATMCAWKAFRASQLKDTVYMDGGFLYWTPGLADGTYSTPVQNNNPLGLIYTLNFSIPFNSSTNVSSILNVISKAPNGGAANNLAPNYYDGAMLANNDEFFLYGGLLQYTDAFPPPDGDEVLGYQAFQYGPVKEGFRPGFANDKLPERITRYVTYGGAANAPSENKAWYFGGYRSPTGGPIYQPADDNSINPINVSDKLITLDLNTQQSEKWSNVTLPNYIPSRANPSMVWVPVGEQGILVVLGGVSYPSYNNGNFTSFNEAQSEHDSPSYMANVDIYDVAGDKWYVQPTIGAPPQLALGCAVVAPAQDMSSYNIYYYGGFDGLHESEDFNDDVWILSLPSFMWMKISSGKPEHARAGHQCLMPYPDQMVTVGGYRALKGGINCLDGGILQVFNLTEGKWLSSYDPNSWNMYGVPEMIHLMIGGDYAGGATITTPTPSGWATQELASVFATTYPASKITPNFPYSSQGPANGTRGTLNDHKGGTPSWVAPVLGVVLGLVFLTAIVVAIMLYRRRKLWWKNRPVSENATDEHTHRIGSWLIGIGGGGGKVPTITTEDPSSHIDYMESRNVTPLRPIGHAMQPSSPEMAQYEMPGNPRTYELGDTSQIPELSSDPMHHDDVMIKHTQIYSTQNSPHSVVKSPSFFTGSVSQDQPSSLSSSQAAIVPTAAMAAEQRPDSPSLGNPSPSRTGPARKAVVSDMSHISEHNPSHLRNLSNSTVSSTTNTAASLPSTPPAMQTAFHHNTRPVSPPMVSPSSVMEGHEAIDYLSAYHTRGPAPTSSSRGTGAGNPSRQSIFRENSDDLGDSSSSSQTHAR